MFAITDHTVPRDRYGRPLLYPPGGGERVPYTRASTAKGWTDSKEGLIAWKASQAMLGLMKSRPLQARVAAIAARNGSYSTDKTALKELVETATTIAGAQAGADLGTACHEMTELIDAGQFDWEYAPEALKGPLEAYQEAMSVLEVVDTEVFVAVDEGDLRIAGSMDRMVRHPSLNGVVVADLKTGAQENRYPLGCMTQVAIYARGSRYSDENFPNYVTGDPVRSELHPEINTSTGLMIHLPLEKIRGKYVCNLYTLDLESGWRNLLLGHQVQSARRPGKLEKL